ncbi:MAG: twin transmembrane helix small protein [Pseudomonadota bacterium]|nr:twin transmembrane helix small protein [Pseudomonadota bacterium]
MRVVVLLVLGLIVGSLASGLYFMMTDKGRSDRAVRALTLRVALSVSLFLLLMAGQYFGLLPDRHL